jgi:hypothetical protein
MEPLPAFRQMAPRRESFGPWTGKRESYSPTTPATLPRNFTIRTRRLPTEIISQRSAGISLRRWSQTAGSMSAPGPVSPYLACCDIAVPVESRVIPRVFPSQPAISASDRAGISPQTIVGTEFSRIATSCERIPCEGHGVNRKPRSDRNVNGRLASTSPRKPICGSSDLSGADEPDH